MHLGSMHRADSLGDAANTRKATTWRHATTILFNRSCHGSGHQPPQLATVVYTSAMPQRP
eukprot:CAMPEP_0203877198 /NCGR_PEP_ID=MMETSP0359-20131031/21836_1 /ASSEMBLY_ACC=CAM_ASM_000338 /TAXON_ID=268821 /ORGANISM="Scrippsiella Hangoei, Strain SHTV-5" /LENGTH=59 /DNA_ID=CAMNT_0050796111 /DNA_START=43 /DNA_END=219 /DNA_ORIENTATION=-